MKTRIIPIIMMILLTAAESINCQTDEGFYYQAAIRDAAGKLIKNQDISIRMSILPESVNEDAIYVETHAVTTSPNGVINLVVGTGDIALGDFQDIDWAITPYFLKLEVDETNSESYSTMGTSQILAVPYALYAKEAGNSLWKKKNNMAYIMDGTVGLGTDSLFVQDPNADTKMEIHWLNENALLFGERRGIRSYIDVDGASLKADVNSAIGIGKAWDNTGNGIGIYGAVSDFTFINETQVPSAISGVGGGVFDVNLAFLQFGNPAGRYRIAGSESRISGTINSQPDSAIVSALIAIDEVKDQRTLAGYFDGTTYFKGNVGIDVDSPQRNVHINDVMRIEPRDTEPENPAKGDIYMDNITNKLRVYDGTQWQDCW